MVVSSSTNSGPLQYIMKYGTSNHIGNSSNRSLAAGSTFARDHAIHVYTKCTE